jgi:polysaccharide export outer membrane protein
MKISGGILKTFVLVAALVFLAPAISLADDYVIGEGDVLAVHVWGEDELNSTVTVRPDGKISMPGVDDIAAAGNTLPQLKKRLQERISTLIKDPILNISLVRSVNSRVFVVGGGVEPRVFDMPQRTTLLHVLASLGPLAKADLSKAYVYRDGKKVMSDFSGLFYKGEFDKDIRLEPGDTVFLPVKYDQNVYVVGAVNQPKAILYQDGLTVLDALLQAGEFSKYANEDEVVIVRTVGDKKERIPVRTKDLLKKGDLKQNVQLQAGDYIIAKESFF